jgi:hypothetical protein
MALAVLMALMTLAGGWFVNDAATNPAARMVDAGWGFGHVLQFAYALLAARLWLALVDDLVGGDVRWPRWLPAVLVGGVLPALVGPWLNLLPEGGAFPRDVVFSWLMILGGWLPGVPVAVWALYKVFATDHRTMESAVSTGLVLSALLYLGGILFGLLIRGDNLMVPAHYHGTVGGITLACMSFGWLLLSRWGCTLPARSLRALQLKLYGGGLLTLVVGLAVLGHAGGERKTPFAGGVEALPAEIVALVLVAMGGLAAVSGAVLFVVLVTRTLVVFRRTEAVRLPRALGVEPRP